jgi:hypothetical protein
MAETHKTVSAMAEIPKNKAVGMAEILKKGDRYG